MAMPDPLSITISGTPYSLAKTKVAGSTATFATADGFVEAIVSHQMVQGRNRRMLRLNHSKIAPDVFTSDNTDYRYSTWVVSDSSPFGYTVAEQKAVIDGFNAALNATSGALLTKLLGGEI